MAAVLLITAERPSWWAKKAGSWQELPQAPEGPVWVVTDLTEETLVEISVPRIFGNDRRLFVQRQLINRFPDTAFRTALASHPFGNLMSRLAPPKQMLMALDPADRLKASMALVHTPVAGLWGISVLLAQLGQAHSLPDTLLIVLGQANSTRIVFLKHRTPVLTRLIAGSNTVAEQALEVVRTVRHLENTHVIARGTGRLAALLLGTAPDLAPVLSRDRIDAVVRHGQRAAADVHWRDALFDLVCKSPPGQLAPLSLRSGYLAQQVKKGARLAMTASVLAALVVASNSVVSIMNARSLQAALTSTASRLTSEIAQLDASIASFGVSPELLRKVLALDTEEVDTAADLHHQLAALSHAVAGEAGARVQTLQWQVLGPLATPCTLESGAASSAPAAGPASEPARKVEIKMTMAFAADVGPRLLLSQSSHLTERINAMTGATVLQDPARALRNADIGSSGTDRGDNQRQLTWCVVLPGSKQSSIKAEAPR